MRRGAGAARARPPRAWGARAQRPGRGYPSGGERERGTQPAPPAAPPRPPGLTFPPPSAFTPAARQRPTSPQRRLRGAGLPHRGDCSTAVAPGGGRGAPRGRDGPHPRRGPRRGPGPGLGHLAARLAARRARLLRARATFPRAPAPGPRSPPPRPGKCLDPPPPGRSPSGRPSPHWASPGRLFSFLPGVTGLPAFHAGPGGDLASARVSNPYIIQSVAPRAEWSCTLQHAEGEYSEVQSPGGLKPLVNGGGAGVCRSSPAGAGTPSGLPSAGFAGAGPE